MAGGHYEEALVECAFMDFAEYSVANQKYPHCNSQVYNQQVTGYTLVTPDRVHYYQITAKSVKQKVQLLWRAADCLACDAVKLLMKQC